MFGVVWDYYSSKLNGKQYKQNTEIGLEEPILVPRAYDPSGLRQESRALGVTILK